MDTTAGPEFLNHKQARLMRKRRAVVFLGLTAPYLISYFQRSAPAVVGLDIAADLDLAPAALGALVSMYALGYAAAQIPAGLLADTWGSRRTISVFVLIAAVGSVLFALSPGAALLSFGRFLVGLGVGFVYVPAVRIMTDWYRSDELATFSGLLLGLGSLGAVFSATPLVLISAALGWRGAFLAVALVTLFTSAFCWLVVRDRPGDLGLPGPEDGNAGGSVRSHAGEAQVCGVARKGGLPGRNQHSSPPPVDDGSGPLPGGGQALVSGVGEDRTASAPLGRPKLGEALSAVFSNRHFYLLGFLLFCFYGTVLSFGSLWSGPYLQNAAGLGKTETGNVVMMAALGLVAGCPLSGYISDKILRSRKEVLLGGACLHLLTYIPLIALAGELSSSLLYPLFLLYGLTGGAFVANYACAKETVAPRYAGTALGAVNIFLFAGGAFFQALMGVVIGRYPALGDGVYPVEAYQAALLLAAGSLALATALFALFREAPVLE